ncbi:WAS/WASL-interacting protein family member 3 [Drosophila persimilis]|uniref:WAS/WASL-interacting protein family member 3 n=1 Tax=Drosophila persimilis TaxID=7234 RepID=UPI000F076B34|nr:WAS/WASL-interacting protein family member 3 [Drosophila persimilis]
MRVARLQASIASLLLLCFVMGTATAYPSAEGPSQWLMEQARALQIDDVTMGELWRTKQPVVITKPDAEGQMFSVTYELSADGTSISRTTTRDTRPARLEANVDAAKPNEDWELLPNRLSQQFSPNLGTDFGFSLSNGFGSTFGSFGSSNGFPQWPAHWPSFNLPPGVTPRTTTKTETDDQGRTVTSVSSFYSGPLNPGTNLFESQFPNSAAPRPAVPASLPVLPHQHFPGQAPPPNPNRPSLGFPLPAMPSPRSTTPLPALAPSFGLDMLTTTPLPPLDDFLQQRTTPRIDGNTDESIPPPLPTRRPTANAPQEGDKSIEDYLSKVNLSPSDILAQNGEVVKTIVDKDGRVLSARFVLSTVREEEQIRQEPQPTK